jgi:hypothetical protein
MRRRFASGILAALGVILAAGAFAQNPGMRTVTGQFALTGRSTVDPLPGEPGDTHFRMYLTGDAARALFDAMKVDARQEACDARPGWREKRIGGTQCATDGRSSECHFVINVQAQTIEGWAC